MAKQATAKAVPTAGRTRKRAVSKPVSTPAGVATLAAPSHHEIAQHAYGLYLARGAHDGCAVSDWLRAEHELRAQRG